jgi:diguanylate cyclase (GGDEF)-like protein
MRVFVRLSYSWYAIGPALVFAVARPGAPAWHHWPVYGLALGAQFALDAASALLREWLGVGVGPGVLAPLLARAYLVDLLLAPIGFLAARSAAGDAYGFLPVLSLAALLALLATDRRERIGETIVLTDAVETAATAAREDALTGLANRRAWDEHLAGLESARKSDEPVSIVVADLDMLKLANDTRGHAFGDRLLQVSAGLFAGCVGTGGFVARLGGDELGVVLPGGKEHCGDVVARLEAALRAHPGVDRFPLSLSLGAASSPPEPTLAAAFAAADARMYERKRRSAQARRIAS